jgi:UDP-N-acetylglucosamine 2-epimerase (non-hydrolysing)
MGLTPGGYVLVTLHRPSLVDGDALGLVLRELETVASELPVVFPVHPRTRLRIDESIYPRIRFLPPLGYLEFLSLECDAGAVLTDSGGVQEETTYLGVPCFTLRDTTERPVTIRAGTNTLLGLDPERIAAIPGLLRERPEPSAQRPPLWDGRASARIADVVAKHLGTA